MADITAATLHTQLGVESTSTPGTIVSANRQMKSFGFPRWKPAGAGQILTPQGFIMPTTAVPVGRTWVEGTFEGVMDYNEICYALASVLKSTTPSADGTSGKVWSFAPTYNATDTLQTYTWEQGNNQHAQRTGYMFFNSLKLEMTPLMQKMSGNVMGQAITDDITLTSTPTILAAQVIAPQGFDVRASTSYALLIGTKQVETATAVGTATGSGNITVTVTAAGAAALSGGKAVTVAILSGDTPAVYAPKIITALLADTDVNAFFNIGGSSADVVLTARAAAANDATMNIAIAAGTTGITAEPTSANTTAGVAPPSIVTRAFGVTLDVPNRQDVISRMASTDTSFISSLQIPTLPVATLRTDADDAGMAYLTNWTAGTQVFLSVTATGGSIAGAQISHYAFQMIFAAYITKGYNPVEDHGNAQAEWTLDGVQDATWGNVLAVNVTNSLAAL